MRYRSKSRYRSKPPYRNTRDQSTLVTHVIEEAAAVIDGRLPDYFLVPVLVPPWGWINKLAHANWDDLVVFAQQRPAAESSWEAAASYLAAVLTSRSHDASTLLELQRHGLIPLELSVLAGTTSMPASPSELVRLVQAEVERTYDSLSGPQSG